MSFCQTTNSNKWPMFGVEEKHIRFVDREHLYQHCDVTVLVADGMPSIDRKGQWHYHVLFN